MVIYDKQREERILNSINKTLQVPSPKAYGQVNKDKAGSM